MNLFNKNKIIVFDGAMGTSIQSKNIGDDIWKDKSGCNEYLNIVAPDIIESIHLDFLKAGADVIVTNTFSAISLVLSEYGLEDKCYEINFEGAKVARKAADKFGKYVAGSIGPGTKLASLNQITFDELYQIYSSQVEALMDGNIDIFIIETCQDILQIKSVLAAIYDVSNKLRKQLPIFVSVTLEENGLMLTGSDITSAITSLRDYGIYSFGLNCSFGPDKMYGSLKTISKIWDKNIYCSPNAGIPEIDDGKYVYAMTPERMGVIFETLIEEFPLDFIGGCCGTTPEHISVLKEISQSKIRKSKKKYIYMGEVSSLFSQTTLIQTPAPTIIGEKANANGSKLFRELLLKNDYDGMLKIIKDQENKAHLVDVCVAYTGRNEQNDMTTLISKINNQVITPIVIDSTESDIIEETLKRYTGKPVINSINLEDGGEKLNKILKLIKKYPSAVIALTIDENGMGMSSDEKLNISNRIYEIWTKKYNYNPQDLIFDPLTFSIVSGDKSLTNAAIETLKAIELIKTNLKGVKTVLGISNISFGVGKQARNILNTIFLDEAVKKGLDIAIANPEKLLPINTIDEKEKNLSLNLIYAKKNALTDFLEYFTKNNKVETTILKTVEPDELLKQKVISGDKSNINITLDKLMKQHDPYEIINNLLLPAMKKVGELFGEGKMLLPFVLQSAEVMKTSVLYLENFMPKNKKNYKGKIVLATVKGDVHDIGKNLVDIILTNNGYKVYNLGIKVPSEVIINKAQEVKADAIGLSGLLVKSTFVMKENINDFKRSNIKPKILLGGAALTESFVKNDCSLIIPGKVYYCKDAFDSLKYLENTDIAQNMTTLQGEKMISDKRINLIDKTTKQILYTNEIPKPPFLGVKNIHHVDLNKVFRYINKFSLFSSKWGYKKGDMSEEEYNDLIKNLTYKEYNKIKDNLLNSNVIDAKVSYAYFGCKSYGNRLKIYNENTEETIAAFTFPRQKGENGLCISDYFHEKIIDTVVFQVVTLGNNMVAFLENLFMENKYKKYYMYHGLFAELTEALAEFSHRQIRKELQIEHDKSDNIEAILNGKYRGCRYSFGYPACPELKGNLIIAKLLNIKDIGIELTDELQMVPEYTTSAIIAHNPEAINFRI